MEMPNEENFTDDMEEKILDIQNKCKFFPPQHIEKKLMQNYNNIAFQSYYVLSFLCSLSFE